MSLSQEDIPWIKQTCERIGVEVKTVENLRSIFKKYGMKKVSELSLLIIFVVLFIIFVKSGSNLFYVLTGVNFP
jgi:hypothetical protein